MTRNKENSIRRNILQQLVYGNRCRLCAEIIPIGKMLCTSCNPESYRAPREELSRRVLTGHSFDGHTCPFYYEEIIRTGIHNFKYKGYKRCSDFFAEEMIKVIERDYGDEIPDYITCVPMTKKKKRLREYNQCEKLLSHIAAAFAYPKTPDILIKIKETQSQVELSGKKRLTNLKGAFRVNDKYNISGKTILLCDDVMTTGSTLEECSATLKKAGAKRVICVTAAAKKT